MSTTYRTTHDSDSLSVDGFCLRLTVEAHVSASSEDEGEVEYILLTKPDGTDVSIESLPDSERNEIESAAQSFADENAYENYYEMRTMQAEAQYDAWKDGE